MAPNGPMCHIPPQLELADVLVVLCVDEQAYLPMLGAGLFETCGKELGRYELGIHTLIAVEGWLESGLHASSMLTEWPPPSSPA